MNFKPPSIKTEWRFYLKWFSIGIIIASIITLVRYYIK